MERMLVVVLDNEDKALQAMRVLQALGEDGAIAVYATRIVIKNPSRAVEATKSYDVLPEGTMGGTAVGSLIGMFGGPVGLAVGAATGFIVGATADFARTRLIVAFVKDVEKTVSAGKVALVAEIDERSTDVVDERMKALGGSVLRHDLSDVADSVYDQEIASIKADLAQAKADHAASGAEHKAKLQARVDRLDEKFRQALDRAKARRAAAERQAVTKAGHMEERAVEAKQEIKGMQADRIAAVQGSHKE